VAKILYLSSQNTVDCYKSFCSIFKFWSPTQLFFPSWNISSIISLVSIIYLALIYNYNTIKYIYFINPRQHTTIHLVLSKNPIKEDLQLIRLNAEKVQASLSLSKRVRESHLMVIATKGPQRGSLLNWVIQTILSFCYC
jgi:hypothetical protein